MSARACLLWQIASKRFPTPNPAKARGETWASFSSRARAAPAACGTRARGRRTGGRLVAGARNGRSPSFSRLHHRRRSHHRRPRARTQPRSARLPVRRGCAGVLAGQTVVVDPGHNGENGAHPEIIGQLVNAGRGQMKPCNTTGTATDSGYPEAAFNFSVALHLRHLLVGAGARVVMTRTSNNGVGPCVNRRAEIGNKASADAVIAIHADGATPNGRGFHVIYPPPSGDTTAVYASSLRLAHDVHHAMLNSRLLPESTYLGQGL